MTASDQVPEHPRFQNWFETSMTGQPFDHPAMFPEPLARWLVQLSAASVVCDPFCGSGTTLRAAKDSGRKAIGIEINEEYCKIAVQRLRQGVLDF